MKWKFTIGAIIVLVVGLAFFMHFYLVEPSVKLKKDLSVEINTSHTVLEYVEKIENGNLITEDCRLDTSKLGYQIIKIRLKNKVNREFEAEYKILVKDTIAQEITFKTELSTTEGNSIDLLKDVKAWDNSMENINVSISGTYNFNTPGKYNLKYVAEDSSHNKTEKDFVLVVNKKPVVVTYSNNVSYENGYPYYIKLIRNQNVVLVYGNDNGKYTKLVKVFTVSAGAQTPLGVYRTSDKYVWHQLVGNVWGQYSTRITGHILFHSVPYLKQTKDSLEYWEYNLLGTKRSLGCIRLTVIDAKWLYDNCPKGTKVEIFDSGLNGINKPSIPKIDTSSPKRGWDPTDPDPANPWKVS